MAARALLADGRTERYHLAPFATCYEPNCPRRHATWDELDEFRDEDRARDYERGKAMAKGELP